MLFLIQLFVSYSKYYDTTQKEKKKYMERCTQVISTRVQLIDNLSNLFIELGVGC